MTNLSAVCFDTPTIDFDSETTPADGGWINITVSVSAASAAGQPGRKLGTAYVGYWVWTRQALGSAPANIYDECVRTGWAIDSYAGWDRRFEYADNMVDLAAILGMDDDDEAEEALLDAALDLDSIDPDEVYRAALIAQLPEWGDMGAVVLASRADTSRESAEEWYRSLGHHVSTEGGDICHPVCDMGDVDEYQPRSEAEEELLEYARRARDAAQSLAKALHGAVIAYDHGDGNVAAVVAELEWARRIETDYGEATATNNLAANLLAPAEDETTAALITAVSRL